MDADFEKLRVMVEADEQPTANEVHEETAEEVISMLKKMNGKNI